MEDICATMFIVNIVRGNQHAEEELLYWATRGMLLLLIRATFKEFNWIVYELDAMSLL